MKYSFNWIKEFLPTLKAGPLEVAHRLTDVGLEVERIEDLSLPYKGVVVGEVLSKARHPNADRLSVVTVFDGHQKLPIVCGAPNVTEGKKYPFARLGATLPNGVEIRKTPIRGIESSGMLCSAKELGLSEEATGLLELSSDIKVGTSFARARGLDDTLLHVAVTPNRGDCLSHLGLAREISAAFGLKIREYKNLSIKGGYKIKDYVKIHHQDRRGCRRYCARVIRGVKVAPSPEWLVRRLEPLGIRSINNVVDATNDILLGLGHPLHAFDHRFLKGSEIHVRVAGVKQIFEALDETKRELLPEDLVIADRDGPVALAGIIGGKGSEIREDTTTIVLEAASFDPGRIRRTSKRLGLTTESSYRFERHVPPETVPAALEAVTSMILQLAGGEASADVIDLLGSRRPVPKVFLSRDHLTKIVGNPVADARVAKIFSSLGLNPRRQGKGWLTSIPPHRSDLTREIDLIEEVVRLEGFGKISPAMPRLILSEPRQSPERRMEGRLRSFFISRGFSETIHLSFVSEEEGLLSGFPPDRLLPLRNPLSREGEFLRPSLLPSLLACCRRNQREGRSDLRFFELRTVFSRVNGEAEKKSLGAITGGDLFPPNWQKLKKEGNLFLGKGLVTDFFGRIPIQQVPFPDGACPSFLHPKEALRLICRETPIGFLGKVHPALLARYELKIPLLYLEIDASTAFSLFDAASPKFSLPSPYPSIVRDLSIVVDAGIPYAEIEREMKREKVPWQTRFYLYDIFEGGAVPQGKKSLTFSLTYESSEKTLTDDEVNKVHFALVDRLTVKLGAALR